ncbi:MAG: DASS family sodium-coupled anion symporter [Planctomycetota bacterium]
MTDRRRWSTIALAAIAAVVTYYGLPGNVDELARRTAAIFVVAVVFWATELIPLYATSLCIIGMQILFLSGKGGMAEKFPTLTGQPLNDLPSYNVFLAPFASGIIILFMGGFLLSAAVTKHGLDKKIAARLLKPFAKKPSTLIFAIMLITAFFSMWMSNTATAVMMIAIITPLVKALPEDDKFHKAVILAVPFGANIGGIGTPIGTPPNAVAMAALQQKFPELGLGFVDWMIMAVPLALILIAVAGLLLLVMFKPKPGVELPEIEKPTEPISWKGRITLMILGGAIFLWVFSGILNIGLSSAAVALLAAAALTTLGVLEKRDVDSIDWNVLILMWGGLSLGKAMEVSGLIDVIAGLPFAELQGAWLAVIIVALGVGMSTFMSNTATANVLVPMVIAIGLSNPDTDAGITLAVQLTVLTALACSFAMAFPVSTPPNAIAFATGKIPASALLSSGGIVSLICVVVLLLGYQFVLPWAIDLSPVLGEVTETVGGAVAPTTP